VAPRQARCKPVDAKAGTKPLIGETENEVADMKPHTGTASQESSTTSPRQPSVSALECLLVIAVAAQNVTRSNQKRPIEAHLVNGALVVAELLHHARGALSQVTDRLASRLAERRRKSAAAGTGPACLRHL
jgi:hypothetical protein